jgi:hypothetical protein
MRERPAGWRGLCDARPGAQNRLGRSSERSSVRIVTTTDANACEPGETMAYPVDGRVVNFIGGIDASGRPLPLSREKLVATTETWPTSPNTPEDIAGQLRVARELFVHCLLVWEFSAVGVAWSLMAVESALRFALGAADRETFAALIKAGAARGMYDASTSELLDFGRQLRNSLSHPSNQPAMTLGMASPMIEQSHRMVALLCDAACDIADPTS